MFKVPPPPTHPLGHHRLLAPNASVRVSPLCLGTMNFGDKWKDFMGECNKDTTFQLLDYFFDNGGNFIDTACGYQDGESEMWIGEWMKKRKNRDEIVLATKFSLITRPVGTFKIGSNFTGNSVKAMKVTLDDCLKRLGTDYIDIYYLHWWDFSTNVEEIMRALNNFIVQGKVLYLAISDTPAWIVVKANEYARRHGLTPFCLYQGRWSAAERDFEREIIQMAKAEGMALSPWGVLGRGRFKPKAQLEEDIRNNVGRKIERSEKHEAVAGALEKIACRLSVPMTSVALAYVMHKAPYVYPVIGGRSLKYLKQNMDALSVHLTPKDLADIDSAYPFDVGFPNGFIFLEHGASWDVHNNTSHVTMLNLGGPVESVADPLPIRPRQ